jgi:hypothetical protein
MTPPGAGSGTGRPTEAATHVYRNASTIELHVEHLVFHGVPPLRHQAVATVIREALTRALDPVASSRAVSASSDGTGDISSRIGGTVVPAVLGALGSPEADGRR